MGLFSDKKITAATSNISENAIGQPIEPIPHSANQSANLAIDPLNPEALTKSLTSSSVVLEVDSHTSAPPLANTKAEIGSKIIFKGEITGEEDLVIQGSVEGTVTLNGYKLTIGENGKVRANVLAKNIVIAGNIEGDLIADDQVSITRTSHVKGSVTASRVTLEDGAKFRGSIDMDMTPT
jgi:cytoskeletal protein CcmA (bactofilin family)